MIGSGVVATYLDRILERTRLRVELARRERRFEDLDREARNAGPVRDFAGAIRAPGMSLIAEVKRRSPSKGVIRSGVLRRLSRRPRKGPGRDEAAHPS